MPWHDVPRPQLTMLRTQTHKLVVAHGLESGELYDLEADPQETHNRWHDPAYATLRMELAAAPLRPHGLDGRSAARARRDFLSNFAPVRRQVNFINRTLGWINK